MAKSGSPGVRYTEFLSSLKAGDPAPLYLLVGEEEYLKSEAERAIRHKVFGKRGGTDDLGYCVFHGPASKNDLSSLPLATVLDEAAAYPMLAENKLVVVRGATVFAVAHSDALAGYLDHPPVFTVMVLHLDKLDGRSKLARKARSKTVTVNCQALYETNFGASLASADSELGRWLTHRAKERGLRMGVDETVCLMEMVGTSLRGLDSALEKLSLYLSGGAAPDRGSGRGAPTPVTTDAIEAVVAQVRTDTIFRLVDAALGANVARTMTLAERTFASGLVMPGGRVERRPATIALMLIAQLGTELERRVRAKSLLMDGMAQTGVEKELGIPRFLSPRFFETVRRAELPALRRQIEAVYQADLALKTSAQNERMLAEGLLAKLRA